MKIILLISLLASLSATSFAQDCDETSKSVEYANQVLEKYKNLRESAREIIKKAISLAEQAVINDDGKACARRDIFLKRVLGEYLKHN